MRVRLTNDLDLLVVQRISSGRANHSLQDEYIAQLESVEADTDPDAEREKLNRESAARRINRLMLSDIPAQTLNQFSPSTHSSQFHI